jgi:cytochrome bd-type quinol oxidase subunit 2
VGLYDWLLFLHVAAAFVLVSALVLLGAVVLGTRDDGAGRAGALARLSPVALLLWDVGGLTVLVFGIWLALNVDQYELWDPWIVLAILLWLVAAACGGNLRRLFAEAVGAPPRAPLIYGVMTAATALLLVVMVFKPGA